MLCANIQNTVVLAQNACWLLDRQNDGEKHMQSAHNAILECEKCESVAVY